MGTMGHLKGLYSGNSSCFRLQLFFIHKVGVEEFIWVGDGGLLVLSGSCSNIGQGPFLGSSVYSILVSREPF